MKSNSVSKHDYSLLQLQQIAAQAYEVVLLADKQTGCAYVIHGDELDELRRLCEAMEPKPYRVVTNSELDSLIADAVKPYQSGIVRLKNELKAVNKQANDDQGSFSKKEANLKDMLDRFAAKNFDNGKRHSTYIPTVTGFKKIETKNDIRTIVTFSIMFPFPSKNNVEDVVRIEEQIESLLPDIANELKVESVRLINGMIQKDGYWIAKFETITRKINKTIVHTESCKDEYWKAMQDVCDKAKRWISKARQYKVTSGDVGQPDWYEYSQEDADALVDAVDRLEKIGIQTQAELKEVK